MYTDPKTGEVKETIAMQRLTNEQKLQRDQFLTQMAAVLAGMDPKQRATFLQSQPKLREMLGQHTPSQN
jgi:DNA-directed RNA polymerase specialized sigma24 family protein